MDKKAAIPLKGDIKMKVIRGAGAPKAAESMVQRLVNAVLRKGST